MRPRPRLGWRLAAVAVLLALAVPAAPLAGTLQLGCDRCPAACPMHAKRKQRLRCHEAPGASAEGARRSCARTPGLSLPGCGFRSELPLAWVAPAVLPARAATLIVAVAPAPPLARPAAPPRGADPPEPEPPRPSA